MLGDKKIMQTQEITIVNKLGLHARASAKLTKLAGSFQCDVWMSTGQQGTGQGRMGDQHHMAEGKGISHRAVIHHPLDYSSTRLPKNRCATSWLGLGE